VRSAVAVLLLAAGSAALPAVAQQAAVAPGAIFRVFLTDGRALPGYGEAALAGDRVVFTLIVAAEPGAPVFQLVNLPARAVDVERTKRYADAVRAAHYARTRGDLDYEAMTQEVQRTVTQLTSVSDPRKRLDMARAARERLLAWSETTYGYRGAEIAELTALFDDVIAELALAAGEPRIAMDLRAGGAAGQPETILAAPSLGESLDLAVAAAVVAEDQDQREAILRAAAGAADRLPADDPVRTRVRREWELESRAAEGYAALSAEVRQQAADARRRGDMAELERLVASLPARDRDLGQRRRQVIEELAREVETMLADVRAHRAAVERYLRVRSSLLAYERAIRPVMSGLDGVRPVLMAIKDVRYTAYERLVAASERIGRFQDALSKVAPPEDLADVHATLASALQMADRACARRRLASSVVSEAIAAEASSSAAGALILADEMRAQLVKRLYPPSLR
jgi:hypothetical protein